MSTFDHRTDKSGGVLRRLAAIGAALCFVAGLSAMGCNLHFDVDEVDLQPSDAGDVDPDACVDDRDDEALCDAEDYECGEHDVLDECEEVRTVGCGDCPDGDECSGGRCSCVPEDTDELCDVHHADACGSVTVEDRCGDERTVYCGECAEDGVGCDRDAGVCVVCEVDCNGLCGMVPDGCGNFVDCGEEPGGEVCDTDQTCQEFQCVDDPDCDPITSCEEHECGTVADGCGDTFQCTTQCDDGLVCEANSCVCVPESDDELCDDTGLDCGLVTLEDACGHDRSVICGSCSDDEVCDANQCVPEACVGIDLETNPEHCGECENGCKVDQICQSGSCETLECPVNQGTNPGNCDPFEDPTGCESGEYCSMTSVFSGGTPSHFETDCRDLDDEGEADHGDSCTSGDDCQQGLFCVGWDSPDPREQLCSKICRRDSHEGCPEGYFCTNPFADDDEGFALDEYGFCTPRCSPDEVGACPSGQRCTPDPNFPDNNCTPHFRCLFNGGTGGKSEGDTCTRSNLDDDGCPGGMVCAPLGDGERCVERCQGDDDCDTDCVNADAPWQQLRYCALE